VGSKTQAYEQAPTLRSVQARHPKAKPTVIQSEVEGSEKLRTGNEILHCVLDDKAASSRGEAVGSENCEPGARSFTAFWMTKQRHPEAKPWDLKTANQERDPALRSG
jgi:hypothetical protein